MEIIQTKAYAKINLGLDVVKRRPDGYHEINMIMQTIDLFDTLTIQAEKGTGTITVTTNLSYLPTNENNLVYKAAKAMLEKFPVPYDISIDLQKVIPVAAGMAGGSSDAAAVLKTYNELFDLQLSTQELMDIGVTLGADIPYCILGGTALSQGIGEILTPISSPPPCTLLLAKPPIHVSTKYVYENLNLAELKKHPDISGIVNAIHSQDLLKLADKLENVLESVTIKRFPVIASIKNQMLSNGAISALMSGSGPTVFGLFTDKEKAIYAGESLRKKDANNEIFITEFYN